MLFVIFAVKLVKIRESMDSLSYKRTDCRVCLSTNLLPVLSLGSTPPANAFLKREELNRQERYFPLNLNFCNDCGFVQLADVVSPKLLFKDYVYVSSTSPSFVRHFEELAQIINERFNFPKNSLIVDIGSNDGILLRPFKERYEWRVLGIDPAEKIAAMASKNGIDTLPRFFSPETVREAAAKYGRAKIISATSVFPHIDDLDAVVSGVNELLDDDGIFLIEAYYITDLLQKNLFDTIYHEHLSYFSAGTALKIFDRLGMKIFDVEKTDTHGGSLRIFAEKKSGPYAVNQSVSKFINEEKSANIQSAATYVSFSKKIETNKKLLTELLKSIKTKGGKVIGYGAAAKGNTLLNYFEIGPDIIDYVVDDSAWKQGLFTPGTRIPVVSADEMAVKKPDYVLILAWNFAEPIMKKLSWFKDGGGKFIIPVPEPKIV